MTGGYRGSGRRGETVDRNPGAAGRIPADRRLESFRLRLSGLVWGLAWEAARRVPEVVAYGLADLVARVAVRVARQGRTQVRRNLERVVPAEALDRTVAAAFRSYARYWVEAFRAADVPAEVIHARTTTDGFEHLDAALDGDRGVIVLLAHHGSWDSAARWAETHGYHLAVVAEVVRPRSLFVKFVTLRETIGLEVVPLRRGAGMTDRLEKVLAANHLVGLLTDRDLTGRAPVVELFGEPARIPTGAAVLSRRTGAPIVPISMVQRPGRGWHLQVLAPLDVADMPIADASQQVARALEDLIRLAPEQWHAFQPVWLTDLPARRRGDWEPAP